MKRFLLAILMLSMFIFFSCDRRDTRGDGEGLNVVTTIFPAFDFVRQVAGDRVNLTMLIPPGVDAHFYEPSPRDIIAIHNSDVLFHVGGGVDRWVGRILHSLDTDDIRVIAMMDMVDFVEKEVVEGMQVAHHHHGHGHGHHGHDDHHHGHGHHGHDAHHEHGHGHGHHGHDHHHGHGHGHGHGHAHDEGCGIYDEHVWTSPRNAILIVQQLTEVLSEADPPNAYFFRQNAAAFIEELRRLDAAFTEIVENAVRRTIVFADRFPFRYFVDAYGLTYFAAFAGCSVQTDASAATIAFLINRIREEQIPVVFHIEFSNERIADTISRETGARKRLFHSVHNITRSELDEGIGYLEIMWRNAEVLREALL